MIRTILGTTALTFLALTASPLHGEEVVEAASQIARILELEMREQGKKTVAVSSFRDLATGQATPVGAFLAEEILTQLAALAKGLTVVERSRTDAVFDEQQLGLDGLRQPGGLDAFVKVLAVDSLVVGTISSLAELGDRSRVHARLIAVPTGEILASTSVYIPLASVPPDKLPKLPAPPPRSAGPLASQELSGITYELVGCSQTTRLITCHLVVSNNGADREVLLYRSIRSKTHLYDQRGFFFASSRLVLGDVDSTARELRKFLITEVPTSLKIVFQGVPSAIEFIKILNVSTADGDIAFRNVYFSEGL